MKDKDFFDCVSNSIIPLEPPECILQEEASIVNLRKPDLLTENIKGKLYCNELGMYALVTKSWTSRLASWIGKKKVLEVMAGNGWLAKALNDCGVDILATDNKSWNRKFLVQPLFEVVKEDALESVKNNSDRDILILSWPPYECPNSLSVIEAWGENKPIVYIGEIGGCTAGPIFDSHFDIMAEQPNFGYKTWSVVYDNVYIGNYTKPQQTDNYYDEH